MATILVADDKRKFRDDAKNMLGGDNGEFQFEFASTPEEALQHLETDGIDVAVLDLRLRGGSDYDISGLEVAERSNQLIPIIMVTDYKDLPATMNAVNTRPDGYPLLVRFLSKQDITDKPDLLGSTVRSALKKRELWSRSEREKIRPELLQHYRSDRKWSHIYQGLHYLTSFAFAAMMIYASIIAKNEGNYVPLIFTLLVILVGEITNVIISQRDGSIARRADKNHAEILQAARFSQLFDACSAISGQEARDKARIELIKTAAANWLVPERTLKGRGAAAKYLKASEGPDDQARRVAGRDDGSGGEDERLLHTP